MFLSAIVLALVVGAIAGGGIPRLADLRLRWSILLVGALVLRLSAFWGREVGILGGLPVGWAWISAYVLIFAWLWFNWRIPGLQIASVGIASNALAVIVNGGQMPIWAGAFLAAGFDAGDIAGDPFHVILQVGTVGEFVAAGGLFGDVIPVPIPYIRDVVSVGDVLIAIGIFWAIVYTMVRPHAPSRAALLLGAGPLERPMAAGTFQAGVAFAGAAGGAIALPADAAVAAPAVRPQSPYLRLVRNRNFSLLWVGQLVSLFGDRIHVMALGALVATRGSELDVGITFAMTAAPNVLLGPLAGALVDRWDRRLTMIGCDLVRLGLVLAVPVAFEIDVRLVYALAFAIASVTLLFRPAKTAIIPAVVEPRDLTTANSAISMTDAAADILGFAVAGVIVTALGTVLSAAFILDASTYLVSAILLWGMVVPRQVAAHADPISVRSMAREIGEGFGFLWRQAELLANTLLSTVAQVAVGAEIVVSLLYARSVLDTSVIPFPTNYALLLSAIAVGSVTGGLLVGWAGDRLPKGPTIIAGFIGMGLSLVAAGFVTSPYLAIVIFGLTGLTNMLFIVPTITLFQERTPQELMGRVVSSRQSLVFGAIALSMGLSGWLAGVIGPAPVLSASGAICAAAGAVGILVPAVRRAR